MTGTWWLAAKVGAKALAEVWKDRAAGLSARVHESAAVEEAVLKEWRDMLGSGIVVLSDHV